MHSAVFERGDDGEYKHLMNVSVNVCNIVTRVSKRPILRAIIKEIMKNSNIPFECPYKVCFEGIFTKLTIFLFLKNLIFV
jgi:hypothetical protein